MNIVNCTPHTINILREDGTEVLAVTPSGNIARLDVSRKPIRTLDNGVILYKSVFGSPSGLPDRADNTIYIVSSLFRSGFDREDLWVPGELVRDEEGRPIGCLGLSR